jgi:hypothetical protein
VKCIYDVAGGRTSHFRPVRDSIAAVFMHARLLHRSIFPWPVKKIAGSRQPDAQSPATGTIISRLGRWMNPSRLAAGAARRAERRRLASSMATGMLLATLPPLGFKTVVALLISQVAPLQPLVVIAVSSLNTPPVGRCSPRGNCDRPRRTARKISQAGFV